MSLAGSPKRDVKFVPETPPSSSHSNEASQEHIHRSKKPRNYKYWSDDEVRKILNWLTLPENDGKLARNKAQACREVAKKLFDGDEYMAISVRSKLMSLEKGFREAEQLRLQLNTCTKDEALINEKIREVSKFHRQCKQLFGSKRSESYIFPVSTSPTTTHTITSIPTPSSSTVRYSPNNRPLHHPPQQQQKQHHQHESQHQHHQHEPQHQHHQHKHQQHNSAHCINPTLPRADCESPSSATTFNTSLNSTVLPHLNEERLRALSMPSHQMRGVWTLPRVSAVDPHSLDKEEEQVVENDDDDDQLGIIRNKRKLSQTPNSSTSHGRATSSEVQIARYAAKQASYDAKRAEYEALKSDYERSKMEYAIRLAEIELDRDVLSIKKLELELQLAELREKQQPKNNNQLPNA